MGDPVADMSSYLSGTCPTELSSVWTCLNDDQFLVSEPCLNVRRPVNWYSKKLSFEQLSARVVSDISAGWRFGSMAWEDKDGYSRYDHTHDCYNKVLGVSCYYENYPDGTVDLGTITVGSVVHHMRMPAPEVHHVEQPVVGQLAFFATPGDSTGYAAPVDWKSADFDGWVYPDGSKYPLSAFDIDGEFETSDGYFTVPTIRDFIRLNPRPYEQIYPDQDYSEFMPQHQHTVDLSLSGSVQGRFKYRATDCGEGHGSHGADQQDRLNPYTISLDYTGIKISDKDYMLSCQESGTETAPSYTDIRTMIYIGKPVATGS